MKTDYEKELINQEKRKLVSNKKNTNMLMAAFMMFIFPIIAAFIGAFIGGYIWNSTIPQIIGGGIGFLLSMVIIKLFDKSIKINEDVEKIYWDDL